VQFLAVIFLGDLKCLDLEIGTDGKDRAAALTRKRAGSFQVIYRFEEGFPEAVRAGLFPFDGS
jgi:hypothetical protein